MRRTCGFVLVALTVVWLQGCGWSYYRASAQHTLTEAVDHIPGSSLHVRTRNGRIEVDASDQYQGVSIEAKFRCRGETQAEAEERIANSRLDVHRAPDNTLVIEPVFPGGPRSGDGASIWIKLPDAGGAELLTSNGGVDASGLSGSLRIDTSNGAIRLTEHSGDALVDTSNGGITIIDLNGSLVADTSNGAVRLENVTGSVNADTSNGSITVSLAEAHTGPLQLDTSNGSIDARVGPAFAGTVILDTSNASIKVVDRTGRISSQTVSRSHGRLVIGAESGTPSSRLDTSNGRIVFTISG